MRLRYFFILLFIIVLAFDGCSNKSFGMLDHDVEIHINRFDTALFQWIDTDDPSILDEIIKEYPLMIEMLGKVLFNDIDPDSSTFYDKLINHYSEPTLKSLYKDVINFYSACSSEIEQAEKELSYGFTQLKKNFSTMRIPAVYLHVSGLQLNIIIADSLISCSVDKYMGADYPLYKRFFYDHQCKSMTPERMAKDCLNAWIKSEFSFKGKDNVLLERMIYEGKIIYTLIQSGYNYTYKDVTSTTGKEYDWFRKFESALWTTIIERKHLYTPDIATTLKYFQPSASTFISEDAPGNPGCFIGYRIVEQYMKKTRSTFEELMNNNDAQDILQKSKYKP